MTEQNYNEFYWELTLAHSDFTGELFNGYLEKIVTFIDENGVAIAANPSAAYNELQSQLIDTYRINDASVRKAINQFVKLGFIHTGLAGYHEDTKAFLAESDPDKKMTLFSKVVYSNSSFGRSVSDASDVREINFLINTLTAQGGSLSREEVLALMTIDVSTIEADHADRALIDTHVHHVRETGFEQRKYNQMRYLWGLLRKLDDLTTVDGNIYFSGDPRLEAIQSETELPKQARDSYLQRLYKNLLVEESKQHYGAVKCMAEKLDYPGLIASHIKPYIKSDETEQFDAHNGLLLSRNLDILFDQGYVSFDENGRIIISSTKPLSDELKEKLQPLYLDDVLLTPERLEYLAYHRTYVFAA